MKQLWRDIWLAVRMDRQRLRWRKQMVQAIKAASAPGLFVRSSMADGLRAIRKFEEVNGCDFNPNDDYHILLISNMGWHFALQRSLKRLEMEPK